MNQGLHSLGVLTQCYDKQGKEADTGPLHVTKNETYEVLQNETIEMYLTRI